MKQPGNSYQLIEMLRDALRDLIKLETDHEFLVKLEVCAVSGRASGEKD
jgi:hypothetical protein